MRIEEARADYAVVATSQDNWPVMTIEEIADVNPRVDKAAIPDDLPVSFVPMPAVGAADGSIRVGETRPAGEVKKGFTAFLEGDVLFAKITPCMENGKMAIVPKLVNGYGFGSTEFHVLRPKSGMDAKYIYYYVSSQAFRGEAERYMTGAVGQKRVSTTYLKQSTIPVAPLDQQKRIVAEIEKQFSRLDEAVANLKRVKANLKRYKAAVLKAAVEGRLVETEAERARREGRNYETGAQLLQRILETRRSQWQGKGKYKEPAAPDPSGLPELPEGWVWSSLGQCFHIGVGATPSRKEPHFWGGSIPWVSSGEVQFGRIGKTVEHITEQGLSNSSTKLNPVGSVLLGMIGQGRTRGQSAILDIKAANNQNCAAIWVPETPIPPYFVFYWLMSRYEETRREGSGNNQQALNKSLVETIPIPLPPLAEQYRVVAEVDCRISILTETMAQVDLNFKRAERLRQSILSRAFSGGLLYPGTRSEAAA
jgi:type I restriction enzyme S subunit